MRTTRASREAALAVTTYIPLAAAQSSPSLYHLRILSAAASPLDPHFPYAAVLALLVLGAAWMQQLGRRPENSISGQQAHA